MELENLKKCLETLDEKSKVTNWSLTLNDRKIKELEHHNLQRETKAKPDLPSDIYELLHGNKKFYSTVKVSDDYLDQWMRKNVPGKVVLDYACGNGGQAIRSAKYGAAFAIGQDLSDVSIENARKTAAREGLETRTAFLQADCENTGLPDACVDVIFCTGVLHHLDLSYVFPELRRLLKKNGKILAVEALDYNPGIKLYRKMTPSMRTDWEKKHILSLKDLRFASHFFDVKNVRYWHLLSIGAVFFRKNNFLFEHTLKFFNWIDSWLLKIPLINLMSWQFTFELHKKENDT